MSGGRWLRVRVAVESGLAAVSTILLALTAVAPGWIEKLTGLEPDGGRGDLEWLVSAAFTVATVVFGVLAGRDFARLRRA